MPGLSLAEERLEWRAGLAAILHPASDLAMEVQETGMTRAADLKYRLLSLQRQCDGTWPVRGLLLLEFLGALVLAGRHLQHSLHHVA